jgi:hypothetical protein
MVRDEEIVINLAGDGRDFGTVAVRVSQIDSLSVEEEIRRVYVTAGLPIEIAKDLAKKVIRRVKAWLERRIGTAECGEDKPPFVEKISVVAWASDLPGDAQNDIPRNVRAIDFYLTGEKRWVTDFRFWAEDAQSLRDGLSRFPYINDLFIIAHGIWEPTFVISTEPRPTTGDITDHFGESYFLSGIPAEAVIAVCKPFIVGGKLHICACGHSFLWEERQEKFFGVSIKPCPCFVKYDYHPAIKYLYVAHGLEF